MSTQKRVVLLSSNTAVCGRIKPLFPYELLCCGHVGHDDAPWV
jgi:hypothetical protein